MAGRSPVAAELAERLYRAELEASPVPALTEADPQLTIAGAYEVQLAGRALRMADGSRLVGRKVGLTSAPMQEMLGVDQPDFGYLLDRMVVASGSTIDTSVLIAQRVECEIAFLLGEEIVGPGATSAGVLAATVEVAPAIEVIDSRIADWKITIADTIADNASSGMAVIGDGVPLGGLELGALEATMSVGGEEIRGRGDAVLGHPANAVAWLANELAAYGESIAAGQVVMPGAVAKAVPVRAGDSARASVTGIGSVEVSFS